MRLITEEKNPASRDIDTKSTKTILRIINEEDQGVPRAVRRALGTIADAVDLLTETLSHGGRLFYAGAGTSGRLGILDAVECPPTFNTDPKLIQGIIAGGYAACYQAMEVAEDDPQTAARDLRARGVTGKDVVVGIAASGRTPYTLGALRWARRRGAKTIAVTCNAHSELAAAADIAIAIIVGPEIVAGSSRMKAGTAQKLVLNMLSTATMIRLGQVYSHWMINVHMTNEKLRDRGRRILMAALALDRNQATQAIQASGQNLSVAFVMLKTGVTRRQAQRLLKQTKGHVRRAISLGHS